MSGPIVDLPVQSVTGFNVGDSIWIQLSNATNSPSGIGFAQAIILNIDAVNNVLTIDRPLPATAPIYGTVTVSQTPAEPMPSSLPVFATAHFAASTGLVASMESGLPMTDLQLWLKADAGVYHDAGTTLATDGQTVEQWNDQSVSGLNASQTTSGLRPTYRANINGKPAILFDSGATTQLLVGGNSDLASQAFTAFAVCQMTSLNTVLQAGYSVVMMKGDGASSSNEVWELLTQVNGIMTTSFDTAYGSTNNNDTAMPATLVPSLYTVKRVDSTHKYLYNNGELAISGSDSGNDLNAGASQFGIGNTGSASHQGLPFDGYVREILYYSVALSDSQQAEVESYLRTKWAVPFYNVSMQTVPSIPTDDMWYVTSKDGGAVWKIPAGVSNPTFNFPGTGGVGTSSDTQALSNIFYQGKYWVAYEYNVVFGSPSIQSAFGVASATSPAGPWTYVTDVTIFSSPIAPAQVWQPVLFFDDDGSVHAIVGAQNNATFDTAMQYYIVDALNTALTSWSAPTLITGTGLPGNITDKCILTPSQSPNGLYNIWYHDEDIARIGLLSSSSLKSGYTVVHAAADDFLNVAGWAYNQNFIKIGSIWRVYSALGTGDSKYIESADNWATWTKQSSFVLTPATFVQSNGVLPIIS